MCVRALQCVCMCIRAPVVVYVGEEGCVCVRALHVCVYVHTSASRGIRMRGGVRGYICMSVGVHE